VSVVESGDETTLERDGAEIDRRGLDAFCRFSAAGVVSFPGKNTPQQH